MSYLAEIDESRSSANLTGQHVVRDLWALRLQTLARSVDDADDSQESSEVFSSQAETDTEVEDVVRANGKKLKWPRLVDSIALCYVAALLMRLPVSVGDFYRLVYSPGWGCWC